MTIGSASTCARGTRHLMRRWRRTPSRFHSTEPTGLLKTASSLPDARVSDASYSSARMRAVVHDQYGPPDVLRLEEVERPTPEDDEVLIRVRATTVTRSDCGWRSGEPFVSRLFTGIRRPRRRILGRPAGGRAGTGGRAVPQF